MIQAAGAYCRLTRALPRHGDETANPFSALYEVGLRPASLRAGGPPSPGRLLTTQLAHLTDEAA